MMLATFRHTRATVFALTLILGGSAIARAQELTREVGAVQRTAPTAKDTAIGLQARFDRADPSYAVGDQLSLTITTRRVAYIEIWELGVDGSLSKILPVQGAAPISQPGKALRLPGLGSSFVVEPPRGVAELHIIARSLNGAQRSIGDADTKLSGTAVRDEVRLRYTIL